MESGIFLPSGTFIYRLIVSTCSERAGDPYLREKDSAGKSSSVTTWLRAGPENSVSDPHKKGLLLIDFVNFLFDEQL